MAEVVIYLQSAQGVAAELHVDADQALPVPAAVDPSGSKRAGDLVPGDCVYNGGRRDCYAVVTQP